MWFFSGNAANPCVIAPSYHKWAPWIGPHTRASNLALNTEYQKGQGSKGASSADQAEMHISEDRLIGEVMNLKVGAVQNLVKECGLDTTGSKMDLVIRLKDQMKSRSAFDKVFQKVWGASGGWAVIMCPCGIINSIKFNVRAESPRDYCDMLLSFKHFPIVVIYDFARGLATHCNLREPLKIPFQPNEGRVAEVTPENLQSAKKGDLKVHLPWLKVKKSMLTAMDILPQHYALYDTFHEANTKDARDCLRKISLIPELHGWVNSQVAEQLFSKMRKNNYFLNMMSPGRHIFLMRSIIHHHNTRLNEKTMADMHKMSPGDITLDSTGRAVMEQLDPANTIQCSEDCEALTIISALKPCRASWTIPGHHPIQEQLLNYVLDVTRPGNELIIKDGPTCLCRTDMLTLGLKRQMESMGRDVFVADLHISPTMAPSNQ
ncbi:HMG domain-containing protein 3 [Merluccius polli]|uniref:HMG domain-containing protein 3 n=1 Tax=Merluccius polli TaxID=89951 RepID=A0AA47N587_MERPO|nr:HMG domain-containing protein 3 [Merluccius polli]